MSLFKTLQSRPLIRRHLNRFREIASVFARYGMAEWLHEGSPEFLRNRLKGKRDEDLTSLPPWARRRLALAELGPTFVKLGQMLSTRKDIVGEEAAEELARLQADVPPDPPDQVRQTILEELGRAPEDIFASFEAEAMASASIGQVHRATLPDGTKVVVKVQHTGTEDKVRTDLEILSVLAEFAEKNDEELKLYQPTRMVAEFERSMLREIDYGREAGSLQTLAENFAGDDTVHFPRFFEDFSSSRVLTMELLDGIPVADRDELERRGIDTKTVAKRGAEAWVKMILRDGFFHADPHPGNILVLDGEQIGVLDCGMTGRVDGKLREEFENLLMALMRNDPDELTEALLGLCSAPPNLDRDAFQADVGEFCADHLTGSLDRLDFSRAVEDANDMIRRHRLVLQSGLAQLLRTLALLEGTSRGLDRDFDLFGLMAPYAQKIALARLSPKRLAQNLMKRFRSWERLVDAAPDDLREILTRVRKGTFRVHLEHQRLNTAVNRGVQGILAGAIFLGSSLLLAQRVPPLVKDVSLTGFAGVVVSVYLGWTLLRAIRRSGGLERDSED